MSHMTVKFNWDGDDLGPNWMNPDNLGILLYTTTGTQPNLLQYEILETQYEGTCREPVEEK